MIEPTSRDINRVVIYKAISGRIVAYNHIYVFVNFGERYAMGMSRNVLHWGDLHETPEIPCPCCGRRGPSRGQPALSASSRKEVFHPGDEEDYSS